MTPGRNEPCPCGSGKKYKKCCYLKEQSMDTGGHDIRSKQSDFFENQEFLIKAINNLRRFTLDKKPHIKEYYKIRKMHGEIVNAMIQYYSDGKFEHTITPDYELRDEPSSTLSMLKIEFDLETRIGAQSFYDTVVYKQASNIDCVTEVFIQNHRYRKPEKVEFLHSMLNSRLGLFEIVAIDTDEGYAYLKEVFTGDEYKIVDVGLSGDRNYGDFYIYTRLINYQGICFGTGLNMVFSKTDSFIKDHILSHTEDYNPNAEFIRFTQLHNQCSNFPDKIRVVANTLD